MASASNLTILNTQIESFEMNNDFTVYAQYDEADLKISLDTSFEDVSDQENIDIRLKLNLQIDTVTDDNKEGPTTIEVKQITSYRYINDDMNAEEVMDKFGLSMISIAYPYIRTFVQGVTALAGIPPVQIPAINALRLGSNLEDSEE